MGRMERENVRGGGKRGRGECERRREGWKGRKVEGENVRGGKGGRGECEGKREGREGRGKCGGDRIWCCLYLWIHFLQRLFLMEINMKEHLLGDGEKMSVNIQR